jgi:hypothetical protein
MPNIVKGTLPRTEIHGSDGTNVYEVHVTADGHLLVDVAQSAPEDGFSSSQASAANTAQTITVAAGGAGTRHVVTSFMVVVTAAAVGASDVPVEVKSGSTVLWKDFLGATAARGEKVGATGLSLACGDNEALTLVVGAGGAGVVTQANLAGYTI